MNRGLPAPGVFQVDKSLLCPAFGKEMGLHLALFEVSLTLNEDTLKRDVPGKLDPSG